MQLTRTADYAVRVMNPRSGSGFGDATPIVDGRDGVWQATTKKANSLFFLMFGFAVYFCIRSMAKRSYER